MQKTAISSEKVLEEIWVYKEKLSDKLLILGHHYQRDEIIQFADKTGDSFELAREAAHNKNKKYIVFCGVHFMAETADILTTNEQHVLLPDLNAGCPMADFATDKSVIKVWEELSGMTQDKIIPITYMNSTAAIKSFVGEKDGLVCTSSNAEKALNWAFERGSKVLFIPDEHLGKNTAYDMGIPLHEIILWDSSKENGGYSKEQVKNAKVILWKGHCHVHQQFLPEDIDKFREQYPNGKVIVHPECMFETVQKSDLSGSTSKIIKIINESAEGLVWAVGTEVNLVERLQKNNPNKKIMLPSNLSCKCGNMFKINPNNLLNTLKSIEQNEIMNIITVDSKIKKYSKIALERMLSL